MYDIMNIRVAGEKKKIHISAFLGSHNLIHSLSDSKNGILFISLTLTADQTIQIIGISTYESPQ